VSNHQSIVTLLFRTKIPEVNPKSGHAFVHAEWACHNRVCYKLKAERTRRLIAVAVLELVSFFAGVQLAGEVA
jgi:hypothetical protein